MKELFKDLFTIRTVKAIGLVLVGCTADFINKNSITIGRYKTEISWLGDLFYYYDGKLVREERTDGTKIWWKNGLIHRPYRPAFIAYDGSKTYYKNGIKHRDDGPAHIAADGTLEFYFNGDKIICDSLNEFKRLIKLKPFW